MFVAFSDSGNAASVDVDLLGVEGRNGGADVCYPFQIEQQVLDFVGG